MRPCPPNGLARAQWFRELAAEVETTDPVQAAYCRSVAATIELDTIRARPLCAMMSDGHGVSPQ